MKRAILTLTYNGESWVVDSNHIPSKDSLKVFLRQASEEMRRLVITTEHHQPNGGGK